MSDTKENLGEVSKLIDLMRARGVGVVKMPWEIQTGTGPHVGMLELHLGPEPVSPPVRHAPLDDVKPAEEEKRGPDGLTPSQAEEAYGHLRR